MEEMVSVKANMSVHRIRMSEKQKNTAENDNKQALLEMRRQEIEKLAKLRRERLVADEEKVMTRE